MFDSGSSRCRPQPGAIALSNGLAKGVTKSFAKRQRADQQRWNTNSGAKTIRLSIDRRSFVRGILFGTAVAAAGLAVDTETAPAMPVDDRHSGRPRRLDHEGPGGGRPARPASPPSPPGPTLLVEPWPPRLRLALGVIRPTLQYCCNDFCLSACSPQLDR